MVRCSGRLWASVLAALTLPAGACAPGSSDDAAPTTTLPVVAVRDVAAPELAARLCAAVGPGTAGAADPTVEYVDLDGDGRDEAVVSATCGGQAVPANGVFADGSPSVALLGSFAGDDLTVVSGAGRTLAAVVPASATGPGGGGRQLVERVVYKLDGAALEEVERRQMTEREYRADFRPGEDPLERSDLIDLWASGVALVEPVTCAGSGAQGSGFLVAPDLVVTNEHVVADAVALRVEVGGEVFAGSVLGADPVRDLALVRLPAPSSGYVFPLADGEPRIGTEVTALGYPLIRQLTVTTGEVSGVGRRIDVDDSFYEDGIQTSAPINPGNSGGPLVDGDGVLLGVNAVGSSAAENLGIAIPARYVREAMDRWRAAEPVPPEVGEPCRTGNPLVASSLVTIQLPPILDSLTKYVSGINGADYRRAWDIISSSQTGGDFERFEEAVSTSVLHDVEIVAIEPAGDGDLSVEVSFTSTQAPEHGRDGQTCTLWDLRYAMSQHPDGVWRIDSSTPLREATACDGDEEPLG